LSGASGKVPSAIHVTPEALDGGAIGKIRNGDVIRLDAVNGTLEVLINHATLDARLQERPDLSANEHGMGRELFRAFRQIAGRADEGASVF
jgi:phosphogluconate dehydratase